MRTVLSSGHAKYVSGAIGILNEVTEARRVVNKTAEYLKKLDSVCYTFHDDTSKTVSQNINTIVKFHNSKVRDLDVSVHFNAGNTTEGGAEVLYYSDNNKPLAARVSKRIADTLGIRNRGAKKRTDLGFLRGTHKDAILIEVCFVNAISNTKAYLSNFDPLCQAIAEELSGKTFQREVEDDMLANAIVINTFVDFPFAEPLAAKLKAPIYVRGAIPNEKLAKHVYVIGGSKDGIKGDQITLLAGDSRFHTAEAVQNYLKR